jgi:hypothetical protein
MRTLTEFLDFSKLTNVRGASTVIRITSVAKVIALGVYDAKIFRRVALQIGVSERNGQVIRKLLDRNDMVHNCIAPESAVAERTDAVLSF